MSRLHHFLFLGFLTSCIAYALWVPRTPSARTQVAPAPVAVPTATAVQQAAAEDTAAQARISELSKREAETKQRERAASRAFDSRNNLRAAQQSFWNAVISTNWETFQALRRKAAESPHQETSCTLCDGKGHMHSCVLCRDHPGKCVTCGGTGRQFDEMCPACLGKGKCYLCFGGGKMICPFCDDGVIGLKTPPPPREMPVNCQEKGPDLAKEKQEKKEEQSQVLNTVSQFIQNGPSLQQAILEEQRRQAANLPPSLWQIKGDHMLLGFASVLVVALTVGTLARHRREAEIRALRSGYLSDGAELTKLKMPEWFVPAPDGLASDDLVPKWMEEKAPVRAGKSPVQEFLDAAPECLGHIRQALRALGRSGNEAEWQAALAQLPQHITALKERANFWEMRPVWQMSSALELLARRLADKPKDAMPSTLRTISAAADLLQTLCAPGIRPNLIIDPPIKVLAVDDDALCLRALTFALQKANLVPDTATNGVEALALATEQPYDVIFMDIQMPEMDGLTACTRIHETESNADTPVVFVTIQSDFHTRAQSTVIGGSDLMAKPFLVFELAVKALTATMRKRLELQNSSLPGRRVTGAGRGSTSPESIRVAIVTGLAEARRTETATVTEETSAVQGAGAASDAEHGFSDDAEDYLVAMRKVLEDMGLAPDETKRQERLGDLYLRVHSFATQARGAGLPLAARVGSTLEALLKKLYEKPGQATASTRNTIATALDLLDELRVPGQRQRLADNSPVHLLVVDDEPLARRAITGALQLAFEKPDNAEDGASALILAAQKPYDVIFTDVQMPGLDGFALCAQLRATATNRTTPVVFITSQDDGDTREQARRSGGNDFIAKPCLPSEITLKALTFVVRKRLRLTDQDLAASPTAQTVPPHQPGPFSAAA